MDKDSDEGCLTFEGAGVRFGLEGVKSTLNRCPICADQGCLAGALLWHVGWGLFGMSVSKAWLCGCLMYPSGVWCV